MLTDTEAELRERLVRMETQVADMAIALQNMAAELKVLSEKVASEKLDETERNAYQRGALRIGYAVLSAALAELLYLSSYIPGMIKSFIGVATRPGS